MGGKLQFQVVLWFALLILPGYSSATVTGDGWTCYSDGGTFLGNHWTVQACADTIKSYATICPSSGNCYANATNLAEISQTHWQIRMDAYYQDLNGTYLGNLLQGNAYWQTGIELPDPVGDPGDCQVGDQKTFVNSQSSNPGDAPDSLCGTDGCYWTKDALGIGLPSLGKSYNTYTAAATTCEVGETAPTEETVLPGKQCLEDGYGNKVCIKDTATNCGEFNGVEICAEDIPDDGQCHLLGDAGFICDGSATPPTNNNGSPQHEVADIQNDTGDDAKLYDLAGGADQQAIDNSNEPDEIDETGTPTGNDDMYGSEDGGLGDFLDGIGSEGEGGGVAQQSWISDIVPDFGLPGSGDCSSASYSFAGFSFDFPGTRGCTYLAYFKTVVGWLIYAYTVFALFDVITVGMRSKI
jgi:hypothetical protein